MIKKRIARALLASTHLNLGKLQSAADGVGSGVSVVHLPESDEIELNIPDDVDPDVVADAVRAAPVAAEESDEAIETSKRETFAEYIGEKLEDKIKKALRRIKDLEARVDALEKL